MVLDIAHTYVVKLTFSPTHLLFSLGIGGSTDPFASGLKGRGKIHVRIQQRNGRKCITTTQGLDEDLDLRRIMKHMKKHCEFPLFLSFFISDIQ